MTMHIVVTHHRAHARELFDRACAKLREAGKDVLGNGRLLTLVDSGGQTRWLSRADLGSLRGRRITSWSAAEGVELSGSAQRVLAVAEYPGG